MKMHLKILILFRVFSGGFMSSTDVFVGTEGQTVDITCQFPDKHKYTSKYFCYEPCTSSKHVLIKTHKTEEIVSTGRYSVIYNISTKTFTVTIRKLTHTDSGVYYCGLDQWLRDTLRKVHLYVHEAAAFNSTHTPNHTVSTWTPTHTSADNSGSTSKVHSTISTSLVKSPVNVSVAFLAVLALLVLCVIVALISFYRRKSNSKARSLNVPIYENPVSDPLGRNQTIEDVYHLYDEMMMSEYSLAGRSEDNDATVNYSIEQNLDPDLQGYVDTVYSLAIQ